MLNKTQLIGRLGGQPEVATTQGGITVTKFTLATSESFRDKQTGERREETEWHRVVMFGKLAEIAQQYLGKGDLIFVEGKLKTNMWEKDGVKRYTTEVICHEMKMLGGKADGGGQGQQRNGQGQQQSRPQQQQRPQQQYQQYQQQPPQQQQYQQPPQQQQHAAQLPPAGYDDDGHDIPF